MSVHSDVGKLILFFPNQVRDKFIDLFIASKNWLLEIGLLCVFVHPFLGFLFLIPLLCFTCSCFMLTMVEFVTANLGFFFFVKIRA